MSTGNLGAPSNVSIRIVTWRRHVILEASVWETRTTETADPSLHRVRHAHRQPQGLVLDSPRRDRNEAQAVAVAVAVTTCLRPDGARGFPPSPKLRRRRKGSRSWLSLPIIATPDTRASGSGSRCRSRSGASGS